jgi:hypothetical protein
MIEKLSAGKRSMYIQIRVPHLLFRSFDFSYCHQVAQVVFWAYMVLVVVEVHMCLCACSVSGDSLRCHFGKEGTHLFDFHVPLPGVFLSQRST